MASSRMAVSAMNVFSETKLLPTKPTGIPRKWKGHSLKAVWAYRDATACTIGYVVRFEGPDSKEVVPFFRNANARWNAGAPNAPRPLFGLDTIGSATDTVVWIGEGEKVTRALQNLGYTAACNLGGAKAVHQADWSALTSFRTVYIVLDNDQAGEDFARSVATKLQELAGSRHVYAVRLPGLVEEGDDLIEWIQQRQPAWDGYTEIPAESIDVIRAELDSVAANHAAPIATISFDDGVGSNDAMPLRRDPTLAEPFPVDELGDILGPAAHIIANGAQAAVEIVGNSLLAAASLAVQVEGDVEVDGRTYPTSIFCLTVAASGDRKSTADKFVLAPHVAFQRELEALHEAQKLTHRNALDSYEGVRSSVLKKTTSKTKEAIQNELEQIGIPPQEPLIPILLTDDMTVEGLARAQKNGLPGIGIFSDEGGRVVDGHAMNRDNRIKSLSTLSNMWDGRDSSILRAGGGPLILRGRRVALHLMMQPNIASRLFSDPEVQQQGFLWRTLPVMPKSLAGSREYVELNIGNSREYQAYCARIKSCLEQLLPCVNEMRSEATPRRLGLSGVAKFQYIEFYNALERQLGPDGLFALLSSFAARIPEHALRIAGVLTLLNNIDSHVVQEREMLSGIALARWYLNEGMRIHESGIDDPAVQDAERLLEWMRERDQPILTTQVYQYGPKNLRTAADARACLQILQEHDLVTLESTRPEAWRVRE